MGNHPPTYIPTVISKNWLPVSNSPNKFRNKLTYDYARKHILYITTTEQLQSFKDRLKQNNELICRVLFYQQYHDNIYHIYTDDNTLEPIVNRQWNHVKIKIVEAFVQLVHTYGLMRVCKQMIGADANGNVKIWVHPDPVACEPFSCTKSETVMLADILSIFKDIEDRWNVRQSDSSRYESHTQYLTFNDFLSTENAKLLKQVPKVPQRVHIQQHQQEQKTNKMLPFPYSTEQTHMTSKSHVPPNTNLYLNINIQVDGHSDGNNNGNININKKDKQIGNKGILADQIGNYPQKGNYQPNVLIRNTNEEKPKVPLCSTSREKSGSPRMNNSGRGSRVTSIPKQYTKKNRQRPLTYNYNHSNNHNRNKDNSNNGNHVYNRSHKYNQTYLHQCSDSINEVNSDSPTRRRDTINFKLALNSQYESSHQQNLVQLKNKMMSNRAGDKHKRKNKNISERQMMNEAHVQFKPNKSHKPKSYSGFRNQDKHMSLNLQNSYRNKDSLDKKQSSERGEKKRNNLPYFLHRKEQFVNTDEIKRLNPQTERQNRPKAFTEDEPERKEFPQFEEEIVYQSESKTKDNNVALLKEELQNILETEIEPTQKPVSADYEMFKASKVLFRGKSYEPYETESEKQEVNTIKEKVEEKKARFAQLKLDARKILQDSV